MAAPISEGREIGRIGHETRLIPSAFARWWASFAKTSGLPLEEISSDAVAQHGRTSGFLLADEIHVWTGRDLWEALTTGLEKIDDSLLVVASTAGRGQDNLAWEFFKDARQVGRGG